MSALLPSSSCSHSKLLLKSEESRPAAVPGRDVDDEEPGRWPEAETDEEKEGPKFLDGPKSER